MTRRPPRSTQSRSSAASDVYKRQEQLKASHSNITAESAQSIVRASVGQIFKRVLEDAGVYKYTKEGQIAFMRFIESIGLVK